MTQAVLPRGDLWLQERFREGDLTSLGGSGVSLAQVGDRRSTAEWRGRRVRAEGSCDARGRGERRGGGSQWAGVQRRRAGVQRRKAGVQRRRAGAAGWAHRLRGRLPFRKNEVKLRDVLGRGAGDINHIHILQRS